MKILLSFYSFLPDLGGIETTSDLFALEFQRAGLDVRVITMTRSTNPGSFDYPVVRAPSRRQLIDSVAWCDLYLQNAVSLKLAWPLVLVKRPWVVVHATWLRRPDGTLGWQDRLKRRLLRKARNIAVSGPIAADLDLPSEIIPGPYRDDLFYERPDTLRDFDLGFVGRLVSDKGVLVLVEALRHLRRRGMTPRLLLVGGGPEEPAVLRAVAGNGLADQVVFRGSRTGQDLVDDLNRCRLLVVPSVWQEPFGIVALEGIACGCVVIGSDVGGLPDAIGPCGALFPPGDAAALADLIAQLLSDAARLTAHKKSAAKHLERFTAPAIARRYMEIFEQLI